MALTKIRLSYSTRGLLKQCDRKFQLTRLLNILSEKEERAVFSRGHAFGKGVQVYLVTQDMDKALFHAWLDYWPVVEDEPKVTERRTLHALMCAQPILDKILEDYEVVSFKGLPAVELGYKLIVDETFYEAGFIDLVLRNKHTGLYVVLEIKYTGTKSPHIDAMFQNSAQGIGYSIVLDRIVTEPLAEYGVLYFICQDKDEKPRYMDFHVKEYKKSLRERLNWFIALGMDVERIKTMRTLKVFPMNGAACLSFMRPCTFFGSCQLTHLDSEKEDEPDPHEDDYSFVFKLEDVIKDHIERIGEHK